MQLRAKTGYSFERKVRREEGFERYIKAPRIKWSGVGRNNVQKLLSLNKNPELFKPIFEESRFIKADARSVDGTLYEIKKYSKSQMNKFNLYSEPIIKVAPNRSEWGVGNPYYDSFDGSDEYNDFIRRLTKTKWWRKYNKTILENIYKSNSGIFSKDGFIPHDEIEFKWVINEGDYAPIFEGYHRLTIVFRLKQKLSWKDKVLIFLKNIGILNKYK